MWGKDARRFSSTHLLENREQNENRFFASRLKNSKDRIFQSILKDGLYPDNTFENKWLFIVMPFSRELVFHRISHSSSFMPVECQWVRLSSNIS